MSLIMRFCVVAVALLTVCWLGIFPEPAFSQRTAVSADLINAADFEAIVKEANERRQKFGYGHEDPVGPPWRTLTRNKLAYLITSPMFQTIPTFQGRGLLMDQALAWDLVHFQNLSDIKHFFQMVNGKDYFAEPKPTERHADSSRIGYFSNAPASPEGGALSALFNCAPWVMWVIESDDPILWALQRDDYLFKIADFGWCVRKQRDDVSSPNANNPDTERGAKSAFIIEDRLSHQLLSHGCSGTGPDQCLGLLLTLRSLNPNHADMVAILKRLDAETGAMPNNIPAELQGFQGYADDPLIAIYEETRHRLWRKGIVLSAKLDHMLANPQAWKQNEIQASVDAAVSMMLVWRRIDFLGNSYGTPRTRGHEIANPWDHLNVNGAMPAVVAQRLQQLGNQAGTQPGCEFGKLGRYEQLPEYWFAYALTKLEREKQACDALPLGWVAKQYISASTKNQRELMAPINALTSWVGESADALIREAIRSAIERECPATDWGADYWGICTNHAAVVEAENKRQKAEREAQERREHALQNDPCTNGASKALLLKLGYADAEGYATGNTRVSCKQLPNVPGNAAIAVFQMAHSVDANDPSADDGDYDLHLILADNKGNIQAQVREKNAAYSDAIRLDSVGIDTGLYLLAPKVRAFGVSTYNGAHCYQCAFSETRLSLFVRSGKSLRKIWSGLVQSSAGDDGRTDEGCTSPVNEMRKLLSMGPNVHAGYADLVITTVTSSTPGYNPDNENQVCSAGAPAQRSTETWIYDGTKYIPKNRKAGDNAP